MIPSLAALSIFFGVLFFAPLLKAQNNWVSPSLVWKSFLRKRDETCAKLEQKGSENDSDYT
jgi:hypothetical protein